MNSDKIVKRYSAMPDTKTVRLTLMQYRNVVSELQKHLNQKDQPDKDADDEPYDPISDFSMDSVEEDDPKYLRVVVDNLQSQLGKYKTILAVRPLQRQSQTDKLSIWTFSQSPDLNGAIEDIEQQLNRYREAIDETPTKPVEIADESTLNTAGPIQRSATEIRETRTRDRGSIDDRVRGDQLEEASISYRFCCCFRRSAKPERRAFH